MANAVGGCSSPSSLVEFDRPLKLPLSTSNKFEDTLVAVAGYANVISHDRWLLDRIATHILAFEDDSHVDWFEGNFED